MQRWSFSRLFLAASIALTVASCDDSVLPAERGSADEVVGDQPRALVRSLADPLTVWVLLKEEASLTRAVSQNWTVRGREVVRELTTTASSTQAPLRDWLAARGIRFRSFWIVNAIKLTADRSLIAEIGRRPDVAKILPDRSYKLPPVHRGVPQRRVQSLEWGLSNVRAPEVWSAFGASGEGIVVANIDTGVQFDHPALVGKYRGNNGDGSFDHNYNWFDPAKVCPGTAPCDNSSHGTHTMGTMVGDDGEPGPNQIGVAPRARWIAAKGCEDLNCSFESLMAAGQWVLAPTDSSGQNPSPDRRPHIVNNSWGGGAGDTFYQEIVQSWVAAGIFPAFANGNAGEFGCATANSPGDYPESYGVGAHNIMNGIAPFSSRGASALGGIIKPNITAPGDNVRSSVPGGGYDSFSGTSMATPHLSGVVALLWSAAPTLVGDIAATRSILDQTGIDMSDLSCGGTPENNNVWGEGRVDAFAAVELAPRGPTGTLTGTVTIAGGGPLAGALISVEGPTKRSTRTDATGAYTVLLPIGVYQVTASAFGYVAQTVQGVEIAESAVTTRDFALEAAPSHPVAGTVTDSNGGPVAGAQVRILGTPIPPAVTDAAGRYSFDSVPAGTYDVRAEGSRCLAAETKTLVVDGDETLDFTLAERQDAFGYKCRAVTASFIDANTVLPLVGDLVTLEIALPFPFTLYGQTYEKATVTPKGYVEFLSGGEAAYTNTPIPAPARPNAAIYAFWDDLVVDGASSVRTEVVGSAPNRQFVIEWRNVSSFEQPNLRVRFEMVLSESGQILFQYAAPTDDPIQQAASATIGLENETGTVAFQYSTSEATVTAGTAVEFFSPPAGFVQGLVTDANDGGPVSGHEVRALQNGAVVRKTSTNSAGRYRMQLPVGSYIIQAGSGAYGMQEVPVTVAENQVVTANFSLKTARAEVKPSTVELVLKADQVRKRTLTLSNTGSLAMDFEIAESGGKAQSVVSTSRIKRREGLDPNAFNTRGLLPPRLRLAGWSPTATGDVIRSFTPTGMTLAWGVGYSGLLWLADPPNNGNAEFTVDGQATGRKYATPWTGGWGADIAYIAGSSRYCQLAVGSDNGIHCWDAATGEVTDSISGSFPWTAISQRGLAYRPDDDSFYVGGWNDGVIYHVKGLSHPDKGAVIGQCVPADGSISGLAWNGAMGVLWASTNSETDSIYELNPEDCTVLSVLAHPTPGGFQGGGLDMDDSGNLWMIGQNPNKVFLVDSGVPAFNDVSWLSVAPAQGTVAPGGTQTLTVTVDTKGLAAGTYLASIFVVSNSAREGRLRIPVSLVVTDYQQGVNAGSTSIYTDKVGDTWSADRRHTVGSWGYIQSSSTQSTSHSIKDTTDPKLYQSLRKDPYAYRFDGVPNGVYQVDLRFAELDNVGPGKRLFDVIFENTLVLPAHDIFYEVGRYAAEAKTYFIEVTDGRADLRLIPRAGFQKPIINALRITRRPDR